MKKAHSKIEKGSATVEFIAGSLVLLLPIVYLLLTFSQVQSATYAAESAARESVRLYARAVDTEIAAQHAYQATYLAFLDQGIEVSGNEVLSIICESSPCTTPGSGIHAQVQVAVPLPLVPDFIASKVPTSVTVSADAFSTIERFRG